MNINVNFKRAIGKTKSRSQWNLVGTEDRRIVELEIPVLNTCAASDALKSGWLLDPDNQVQDEKTGYWTQVIGERSIVPISVIDESKNKEEELSGLIDKIYEDSCIMEIVQMNLETVKNKVSSLIITIVGIPIILAALIIGAKVLKG